LPNAGAGIGAGIGAGVGAGIGAGIAGNRPSTLPGLGGGNRPGDGIANRPGGGGDRFPNAGDRWQNMTNNRGDFINNRHDAINDRMQNRDDWRQNWQENRGDRWDNWQDNWHDRWGDWHDGWHHGWCGGGYWGNWWDHMWSEHPVWSAFGITNWALNAGSWLWGFGGYSNPYYDSGSVAYDYSQPIVYEQQVYQQPQTTSTGETLPPGVTAKGLALFDEARGLFQNKQYQEALNKVNEAIKEMPQDAALHEFKALCHFTLGDYKSAAATLYAVLSAGPGWDWTTMYNLFSDIDEFTVHLRKLEDYCREHKDSADAYFELAYLYLTMDNKDLAIRMYQVVAKLLPGDAVTKQMLQMLNAQPLEDLPQTAQADTSAPAIPVEKLAGDWKAMGPNNTEFKMKLTKEGEFNWAYTEKGKTQSIKGAYGQQGGHLVMQTDGNNSMVADVKLADDSTMEFQMTGVASSPKLLFKK
jgi:tetratricopeptide (TPR) repeat protein